MPYTGDVAVYRLLNNGHFYTTDCNEAQTLVQQNWTYEGVQCYLSSAGAPGLVPLYRLSGVGMHFYTANEIEKDTAVAEGWVLEGAMGYVSFNPTADTVALYRALNPGNTDHFYTTDQTEFNKAVAGGWTDEGITGYVSNQTTLNCAALSQVLSANQSDNAHMQAYLDCLNKQGSGIFGFLSLMKTVFVDQDIVGADADAIMQAINQGEGCEACLTPQQKARKDEWAIQFQQALNARTGGGQV